MKTDHSKNLMEKEEQENFLIKKEMESLKDDALIAIVKNENEENVNRLQIAWELLDSRGLKEALLLKIAAEDETKELSITDLVNLENEEEISDNNFADKVEFLVGSEIRVTHIDVLGVAKPMLSREAPIENKVLSEEEKLRLIKKLRVELIISVAGLVLLLVIYAITDSFKGKLIIEWSLAIHSLMRLIMAFFLYLNAKND